MLNCAVRNDVRGSMPSKDFTQLGELTSNCLFVDESNIDVLSLTEESCFSKTIVEALVHLAKLGEVK